MTDLKRSALWYAERGWPVIPLHSIRDGGCTCGRGACGSPGKHPRTPKGLTDASTDAATIDSWWSRWSDANIGIVMGAATGVVAIDIDPRNGGDNSRAELEAEYGKLPPTVEALTGGGGQHLFFTHPGGKLAGKLGPGIDVKAIGGYVVAAPSTHVSGERYRWREGHGPHERSPVPLPGWLRLLLYRDWQPTMAPSATGNRPGDDFNSRGDVRELLTKHGWQRCRTGLNEHWTRPGKPEGTSATLANGVFYVFTTNAPPFEAIRAYSPFGVFALLECDGDYGRAARELSRRGFGDARATGRIPKAGGTNRSQRTAHDSAATLRPTPPFVPFPVDALPDRLRVFVQAVAAATGTDPAFAALAALVVAAGCIGNRVAALVKSGWTEPAVLWGVLVGRSGTTKSPVLKLVTRALIEQFKTERRVYRDALNEYQRELERHAVRMAEWKQAQRKGPPTDPPEEPELPTGHRLVVSDVTVEKLGCLLEENPLGLLLLRDELAAWVGAFDRYASGGKGSDQPAWLSMYDAAPVTIDRKSGKGTYFVERAAVSVVGSIQPGTLARIFGTAEREAGLLARVLVAYPPDRPALWTDEALSEDVAAAWRKLLEALLALPPGTDEQGDARPRFIPIGREAKPLWVQWHDRHAREQVDIGNDDLAAHYAKLKGACVRIALLFACVDVAAGGDAVAHISADAMRRAIAVTEWFKSEGRRVYAVLGENEEERNRRQLVEWIERRGGSATVRDLTHGLQKYRGSAAAAKADLDALEKSGFGRWTHPAPGQKGGRPSPRFALNAAKPITKTTAGDAGSWGFGCGVSREAAAAPPPGAAISGAAADCTADADGDTAPDEDQVWGEV